MNKKVLIFAVLIAFTFGYTVYESIKLDSKLSETSKILSKNIISELPANSDFENFEGKKISLQDIVNSKNFVIVHFWATWCAPCKEEFPELVKLSKKLSSRDDIKFVLIAVDDNKKKALKFIESHEFNKNNLVSLLDNSGSHKNFGTYKLPETFLFGPKNDLIQKFSGKQSWDEEKFENFFKSLKFQPN